ncbi:rust resistance kinase Lr10-like [Typha latifolia]|uniref:rust resistance kinase Lr10-like n=1 Tax=Typha latifolia TaxID=4733 RepID=UPI003C30237F
MPDPTTIIVIVVVIVVIIIVVAVIGHSVVPYLIYKYANKHGLPSVSIQTQPTRGEAPSVPPFYATVEDSEIRMATIENFLNEIAGEKPIRFLPHQIVGCTRNYLTKLGSGGFGDVYKGELPNGVLVAVKVLNGNLDKRVEEQFMAEVGTIGRTYHINLVRLYGFCFDLTVRALVYEYMENGSLDDYLFDNNRDTNFATLLEIATGVAKGIRYLHEECQQRIIHYDIKPGNILLDQKLIPKVADFGLAKLLSRDNTHISMMGGRGTPGYAAPEMWASPVVTYKCDVYSFGMLLFEIAGRRRIFEGNLAESQQWLPKLVWEKFEVGQLWEIRSLANIGEEDKVIAERMFKVALWCVQYQAEARPPMSKVVKMLEGEMEIHAPPNPFKHMLASGTALLPWSEDSRDSSGNGSTGATPSRESNPLLRK